MTYAELPGAEIALRFLALKSRWPGELDGDMNGTRYSEYRWSDESGGFEPSEPHFTTYINCSDTFFWGCSDAEELTEENIHLFEETIAELAPLYREYDDAARADLRTKKKEVAYAKWQEDNPTWKEDGLIWGKSPEFAEADKEYRRLSRLRKGVEAALEDLFAARSRKMRPQGACYKRYPEELWPLFNEAGPERETGFGNPYKPGEYK